MSLAVFCLGTVTTFLYTRDGEPTTDIYPTDQRLCLVGGKLPRRNQLTLKGPGHGGHFGRLGMDESRRPNTEKLIDLEMLDSIV